MLRTLLIVAVTSFRLAFSISRPTSAGSESPPQSNTSVLAVGYAFVRSKPVHTIYATVVLVWGVAGRLSAIPFLPTARTKSRTGEYAPYNHCY